MSSPLSVTSVVDTDITACLLWRSVDWLRWTLCHWWRRNLIMRAAEWMTSAACRSGSSSIVNVRSTNVLTAPVRWQSTAFTLRAGDHPQLCCRICSLSRIISNISCHTKRFALSVIRSLVKLLVAVDSVEYRSARSPVISWFTDCCQSQQLLPPPSLHCLNQSSTRNKHLFCYVDDIRYSLL